MFQKLFVTLQRFSPLPQGSPGRKSTLRRLTIDKRTVQGAKEPSARKGSADEKASCQFQEDDKDIRCPERGREHPVQAGARRPQQFLKRK